VATKAIFGKPVQTVVDIIHAQLTRTEKMSFHEKDHVLMNFPKITKLVLCFIKILAITREVENWFRENASS